MKPLDKWRQLTIKTKIMILYSVLSAALLAILIPAVYSIVVANLKSTLSENMEAAAQNVLACLYEEDGQVYIDESMLTPDMIGSGIYVYVSAADTGSAGISADDENTIYLSSEAQWAFEEYLSYENSSELKKYWDVYICADEEIGDQGVFIRVIGSVYYNSIAQDMAWILAFLGVAFFLISVLGSRFIVKRALWPVQRITQTAVAVSEKDRSKRIEGIISKDEVGELADTFNRMLDELEEAFKRERQFTSDVSHELRTPLTVIETCADDALSTEDPEIIRENLKTIKKENSRMTKMISQLLFLSRGYEGRIRFEPEEFGLYEMAQSVKEFSSVRAEEKNITIHNDIPEDLMIYADQSLFTQLLINLADNAVKYGNENGNVWFEAMQREDTVRIIVRDDGAGIAPEDLDHIFERFYRADRARDRSGQGLGLSIAKWIVKLHGGEISAESEPDKGTAFYIDL